VVSQADPSQDAILICDGSAEHTIFRFTKVNLIPEGDSCRLSYGFVIEASPVYESGECTDRKFQMIVGDILTDILDQNDYTIGKK